MLSLYWCAGSFLHQVLDTDERSHQQAVEEAMRVIGFSAEEVGSVRRILAAILHLVSCQGSWGLSHRGYRADSCFRTLANPFLLKCNCIG